jgi:hypothetical protein
MTYNPNIPLVTDYMVNSQTQIKSNFQTINSVFAKNHVLFNVPSQGMHNVLNFRAQTADPTTATDQVSLYTKTIGNDTVLFYAPSNSQTPIQLTYPSISTGLLSTDPDVFISQQYSFLAGPFVIYLGNITQADNTIVTLTPSTTLIYVGLVIITPSDLAKGAACATNILGNQFTVRLSNGVPAVLISYIAIGV